MAGRPKKAKEEKEFSLIDFNRGYPRRPIEVGQRVKLYRIPYKAKWESGSGVVVRIISLGNFSAYCDVRMDRSGNIEAHHIYLGKLVPS